MKAMTQDVYGAANILMLNDIDMPVVGDDQALLRVYAAGVGPDVRNARCRKLSFREWRIPET